MRERGGGGRKGENENKIAHISFAQCAMLSVAAPILSATFSRGFAIRHTNRNFSFFFSHFCPFCLFLSFSLSGSLAQYFRHPILTALYCCCVIQNGITNNAHCIVLSVRTISYRFISLRILRNK